MDDTDRKLMFLVYENPRMHVRELAKRLGISRQAVHRRMQVLKKSGVIQGATAGISAPYLDAVPVLLFGRSRAGSIEETLSVLGESEFTRRAVVAGGNFLYIVGLLRDISELENYSEFVKRAAEIPEPTVGIYSLDEQLLPKFNVDGIGKRKQSYRELSPLDIRIIASLKDDARKSIANIAKVVGASAKTVRRHLENMISEGSLDLYAHEDLPLAGDMLFVMHVNLRDGADKVEVGKRLLSKSLFEDQFVRAFINLPGFLHWAFWSADIAQVRKALREVSEDEDVLSVVPNFVFLERIYPTWRDKLSAVGRRPSKKA